jgi:hypothetical protein
MILLQRLLSLVSKIRVIREILSKKTVCGFEF